jgi:hypothetical protein
MTQNPPEHSFLRDESLVALNEVIVACYEAADSHQEAAAVLAEAESGEGDLEGLFRELAERRFALAELLSEEVRHLGDLPDRPDSDKEALAGLGKRLLSHLVSDRNRELIEESQRAEELLAERLQDAAKTPQPAAVTKIFEALETDLDEARGRLNAAGKGH